MVQDWKRFGLGIVLAVGGAIASTSNALAQNITLDGTLGPARTLNGPDYIIQQADGQTVGSNLFHSFGRFNLNINERANFQSGVNIRNILSRVTGGSPSTINGLIFTESSNVNLFLINPSGIIFGPNARLDVGSSTRGSFIATTTDALVWSNGSQFSATNPSGPSSLLTIVGDPSGFLATVNQPRPINVQPRSTLNNPYNGQSLLLVGGDVTVNGGTLQATGGRVELGGLADPGTVGLNTSGNNLSLNFPANVARASVSLTNGAEVNVASGGGGSIAINAQNIDVLGGSYLRAGISPLQGNVSAQAGDVNLNATGTLRIENSYVYNAAFDSGNGGDLRVDTGKLIVQDGVLATATLSQGRAGDLIVKASDSVELTGSPVSNGTTTINIPVVTTINLFGFRVNFTVDFPVFAPIGLFSASIDARNLPNVPFSLRAFLPTGGGNVGNLTIDTGRLIVSDGALVSASTATPGRGGNLTVNANEFIELRGTSANDAPPGVFTVANRVPSGLRNGTDGGPGGNLTINTGRLIVRDGAWVTTGTGIASNMPGGELTVNALQSVEVSGTSLANGLPSVVASGTQGAGKANNLTINTRQLRVRDGAIITAGTSNSGQGGDLTINASDSVELIGTSGKGLTAPLLRELIGVGGGLVFGFVEDRPFPSGVITGTAGNGDAGNLSINTERLSIQGGAQASVSTVGAGNAGDLTVSASAVEINGTSQQNPNPNNIVGRSLLTTAVGQGSTGNGGDISVQTNSLTITDGAALTASTSGEGNPGNIFVQPANSVFLSNNGLISTETSNAKSGGSVTIEASTFEANNGGQVITTTSSSGRAGDITLNVADRITFEGTASGLFANTTPNSTGQGGDLTINTELLQVQNGAQVTVSSPQGQAGDLTVTAKTIRLDRGSLTAETAITRSETGANIRLQGLDFLLLQNGSLISARANGTATGGNITIDASKGFVVALPRQDSDIIANASFGQGGNITINTQGIFGLAKGQAVPRNRTNDIDASSQFNNPGTVTIVTPEVDPVTGLVDLPTSVVDASALVASNCAAFAGSEGSSFVVTGRGGLPPSPDELLSSDVVWTDTRLPNIVSSENLRASTSTPKVVPKTSNRMAIIPATGWVFNDKGEVTLISHGPNATMRSTAATCPTR